MTARRLAAIFLADVVGYSRLMHADEVGTLRDLKDHYNALLEPGIAAFNGRIVNTPGDSVLAEFASVVDAVSCAVAVQRAMVTRNAVVPDERRITFRIGINVGDVIVDGSQIFGDGVNIAARVEALCEPGGLCISRVARDQIRDKVPFSFLDKGEHSVKNILRPVRIFELSAAAIMTLPEDLGLKSAEEGRAEEGREQSEPLEAETALRLAVLSVTIASGADNDADQSASRETMGALAAQLPRYQGAVVSAVDGEVVATFQNPAQAVAFALQMHDLAPTLRSREGASVELAIGIHLSDFDIETGRPFEEGVGRAQAIGAKAPPGATLVGDSLYRAVRMKSDFGFESLGGTHVESAGEPVELYRVHGREVAVSMKPSHRPRPGNSLRSQMKVDRPVLDIERPSIAVLPLRDLSGDPEQDYFADGTTDDIITNLTRFRGLDVIASGSTFAFRDGSAAIGDIGQRLRARYVAHGSIRRSPSRIRVGIQVDDVPSGRIVWAERYDRPIEDIFAIQDEIAELSAAAMAVKIEEAERTRVRASPPGSLDAYGFVLRGQSHVNHFTAADTAIAQVCYQGALDRDPQYGRAHAGVSRTHTHEWRHSWSPDPEASLRRAVASAVSAIEADPNDARGYAQLGFVRLYAKEHDLSLASYRRALALNPNDASILAEYADALAHSGQPEEALALYRKAMRLNPFYPDYYLWTMAGAYFHIPAFDETIACVMRMNNITQGRRLLAASFAHLGRLSEARRIAEEILADEPGFSVDHWARVVPDRRPEDMERYITGLKMAGL
ncbi:MAG: tetratricopeptide repeat protein [Methylobacteriaceae bacterium]|nr:tetratricopeptide repeat protein [Methylobacteriaceae bacterium]